MRYSNHFLKTLLPHIIAAGVALLYAWFIFNSSYLKTGLQFVAPVIFVLMVHLLWLAFSKQLKSGFSTIAFQRTSHTTLVMALGIVAFSLVAPKPVSANTNFLGEAVGMLLGVVVCLAMLAVVLFIAFLLLRLLIWIIRAPFKKANSPQDDPDNNLHDYGTIIFAFLILTVASAEGVPNFFAFSNKGTSTASVTIDASPKTVWQTMQRATSPAIPLPNMLSSFPKPTNVVIDEGTTLGANRKVLFEGREGTGYLTLRVMQSTPETAVFHVLSDTTPFANWVSYKTLSYTTHVVGDQTQLDVTLTYERDLAPSWFFTPVVKFAAYLAMGVLAKDVKNRAEEKHDA